MFVLLLAAAILAVVVMSASAQPAETKSYIVMMDGLPVVAYDGGIVGLAATKPAPGEKINPNDAKVKRYVNHLENKHDDSLRRVNAKNGKAYSYAYSFNGYSAELTESQAKAVKAQPEVLAIWENEEVFAETSTTPDFLGLTAEGGLWDMGVTGEDVIIGIVDSGIWPESMSFTDRTGTNPNGKAGKLDYHQIPGWHGKCVPGEEFNASMCNQKLIGAQYYNAGYGGNAGIDATRPWEFNSARDYGGHGTHTASTAGGNKDVPAEAEGIDLGAVSGMAPRARISAYKALWDNGAGSSSGWTNDLTAAIDQAVADGVDVINYSISGSRTSVWNSVSVAFFFASDAGIFVATSAGNSGPGATTVAHNYPWTTTVAAGTHDRYYEGSVTLGDGNVYYGASVDSKGAGPADLVYAGDAGDPLCAIGSLDPAVVTGKIVVCDRGAYARVDKSYAVMEAGGIGMVHANTGPSSINADLHFVPTVHVDHVDGAAIRAYAQTPGATATLTGGVFQSVQAPEVAAFSSRGPALAGNSNLIKPDIMAPGVDVLAAVAPPGNSGRDFDFYSGTSMSSPHIAGLAALLMQAHPDWSPMMVKSALMTTASTMTNWDNPIPGDYFDYGAGQVVPNSAFDPGLVYDAGWNDFLGYLCEAAPEAFANPAATCAFLDSVGYATSVSGLNYPSIAISQLAGSQTVYRTVTNVGPDGTYNVSVDAPAGVDVTVEPATLTLATGESATYAVTFTANASVVADAWTFGSLTWSHAHHNVTSPIALYPVKLGAPVEILELNMESGTDSFEVAFGYTGDYSAAPHGLAEPMLFEDNVVQDPDQDFDKDDGYSNLHQVTTAGAAYMRIAMPPEATEDGADLDIFVYNSAGDQIASSTSGGTNELIKLRASRRRHL
jgi:subtilisin family serine protease